MTSPQPKTDCQNLQQFYRHLLELKKDFDSIMAEINSLHLNFSTKFPEIKQITFDAKIVKKQIRDQIDLIKKEHSIAVRLKMLNDEKKQMTVNFFGKTRLELEKIYQSKNIIITDETEELLPDSVFQPEQMPEKLELIHLNQRDLGLTDGATYREIITKSRDFGLTLCPPQVGPYLRSQYDGQDTLFIAMEPIFCRDGYGKIFLLSSMKNKLFLQNAKVSFYEKVASGHEFVFVKPSISK